MNGEEIVPPVAQIRYTSHVLLKKENVETSHSSLATGFIVLQGHTHQAMSDVSIQQVADGDSYLRPASLIESQMDGSVSQNFFPMLSKISWNNISPGRFLSYLKNVIWQVPIPGGALPEPQRRRCSPACPADLSAHAKSAQTAPRCRSVL